MNRVGFLFFSALGSAPCRRDSGYMSRNLQRPRSKPSVVRLPDRYKFADAACIARQAQGRADASCDFKWHARALDSKEKRHGRRKHLKSSIRTPRSAGKFISVGGFFSLAGVGPPRQLSDFIKGIFFEARKEAVGIADAM